MNLTAKPANLQNAADQLHRSGKRYPHLVYHTFPALSIDNGAGLCYTVRIISSRKGDLTAPRSPAAAAPGGKPKNK